MSASTGSESIAPQELLARLIRFDTSNPPGGERACIAWLAELLGDAGLAVRLVGRSDERPNLIAHLPGRGEAPPLLFQGHVDVVPATEPDWSRDPFGGEVADGFVWGRGSLDMKAGVAMMVGAVLDAAARGLRPAGDVLLATFADEEAGSGEGADWVVREHPELLGGVRYAIGEFGGFSTAALGRRLYPIQVAEKAMCWLHATWRGAAGHGALAARGGALARLGRAVDWIERHTLPLHLTPVLARMLTEMGRALPAPAGATLTAAATRPRLLGGLLRVGGSLARQLDPLARHTASSTIARAGAQPNVVPASAELTIDGRLLPGFAPADLIAELRPALGDAEIEVIRFDGCRSEPDWGLFPTLAGILREADPDGHPVPMLMPASTDGRFLDRLGIQTYGFTPMRLHAGFDFQALLHAADERIPVGAVEFGTRCLTALLERYGED